VWDIITSWADFTVRIVAPARRAMSLWPLGEIACSLSVIRSQLGIVSERVARTAR